ncbi:MAG: hypothetical protein M1829_001104 [Trizodia sp. TS-e1964]|nr:MAG: hypothetical protein M1829_001104 [Trizodia sp. TS-e1964]
MIDLTTGDNLEIKKPENLEENNVPLSCLEENSNQKSVDLDNNAHNQPENNTYSSELKESSVSATKPVSNLTAELLYDLFQEFKDCSAEEHNVTLAEHMAEAEGNHHPLSATYYDSPVFKALLSGSTLTAKGTSRTSYSSPFKLSKFYNGWAGSEGQDIKNICLHVMNSMEMEIQVSYDIDSFLGFASSLAFAKQGLFLCLKPLVMKNIQTNLHITCDSRRYVDAELGNDINLSRQHIKDVPYIYLGHIEGQKEVCVYALFSALNEPGAKFFGLTEKQLSQWTDKILLPALSKVTPSIVKQHYSASYNVANLNACARFETLKRNNSN